jgi:two-component system cell cycle response regulator
LKALRAAVILNQDFDRRRATDAGDPELLRLLVVEDDPHYRAWLAAVTRRMGFAVEVAPDGQAALDLLSSQTFEIAVVDQEMPRMTGIEVIARVRELERNKTLYAIMLTGRSEMEVKLRALDAGFDDFLSKSSPEAEIVAKLVVARRIAARQRTLDTTVRELYGLATRDELTGVFNRRFFVAEAERLLAARSIVDIVLFDLDDFKHVNDTYGHLAGDRVLRDVATLIDRNTRAEDLIARFGGDEFVMCIPHLELQDLGRLVGRLAGYVRELRWSAGGKTFAIGITTGLATSRQMEDPTLAQLLEAADRDLYRNKAHAEVGNDARIAVIEPPAEPSPVRKQRRN